VPGDGGRPGAQLDSGDSQSPLRERHGRLPGVTADLGHPVSGGEPGQSDQIVKQLGWADGPAALVRLRCLIKSGAQVTPLPASLHEFIVPQPSGKPVPLAVSPNPADFRLPTEDNGFPQ
jgi:hypothetical protein